MSGRTSGADLDAELAEVYRAADALYAGWSCDQSTDCCHFGRTGREPYVTTIEARAVVRAMTRRGVRIDKKTRLPMVTIHARDGANEGRCPLLDGAGRCTIYDARPLGCRTFYCDRAKALGRVKHRDVQDLVARVRAIAARFTPGDDVGAPLTSALVRSKVDLR